MKQLLEYIIPNIVNHPDEVEINETSDNGNINLTIKVNPEDTGRVIGKAGKVIKAIRQIARVIAIKQGVRVNIDVLDGQSQGMQASSSDSEEVNFIPETQIEEEALEDATDSASEEDLQSE